ncbi:MAG: hypothetical protein GY938_12895 [Ketobacter sp.]|nr:hypothetical protein [Ketobacter sp.]
MTKYGVTSKSKVKSFTEENGDTVYSFGNYDEHLRSWRSEAHADHVLAFYKLLINLVKELPKLNYVALEVDFDYSLRVYVKPISARDSWSRYMEFNIGENLRYRNELSEKPLFEFDLRIQSQSIDKEYTSFDILNTMEKINC